MVNIKWKEAPVKDLVKIETGKAEILKTKMMMGNIRFLYVRKLLSV